jgi:hypothetical protein
VREPPRHQRTLFKTAPAAPQESLKAALASAGEHGRAWADVRLYGDGFLRVRADGSLERLDPRRIVFVPEGAAVTIEEVAEFGAPNPESPAGLNLCTCRPILGCDDMLPPTMQTLMDEAPRCIQCDKPRLADLKL